MELLGLDRSKVLVGLTVGELLDLMEYTVGKALQKTGSQPTSNTDSAFISKSEAAELLGHDISKTTWRSAMPSYSNPDKYTETLPVHRLSFKKPMYKKDEVLRFRDQLISGNIRPINKLGEATRMGSVKRKNL